MKVLINIIRIMFVICLAVVGASLVPGHPIPAAAASFAAAMAIVLFEYGFARRLVTVFPSIILGLVAGFVASYVIVKAAYIIPAVGHGMPLTEGDSLTIASCVLCYLAVACVLRTKDDLRVVIPYVKFARQQKGPRPLLMDTSAIVDGRMADICETGIVESDVVIPKFILLELQEISDSSDRGKRNRGRRGMDMLQRVQRSKNVEVVIDDSVYPEIDEVDSKLVALAKDIDGRIVTTDYNLGKVAELQDVTAINVNDLASALKPVVLPGEILNIDLIKPGEEPGQGVGYLDDGTMVVVDGARDKVGDNVAINVTSVIQTTAGRMIFGKLS